MKITSSSRPLWSVLLYSLVCTVSWAQSPANDNCTGAILLTVGGPAVAGNLSLATDDVSAVKGDGCSGTTVFSGEPGLWYRFVGTGDYVWPTTCLDGSVANDVSVYKGTSPNGCASLTCVVGMSRPCGNQEKLIFATDVGVTYYVLVSTSPLFGGNGKFQIQIRNSLPLPSNDVCVSARPLSYGTSVFGNVTFAQSDELEVVDANSCVQPGTAVFKLEPDFPGLWYTFVGTGGRVWPNVCFPNSIQMDVAVYQGGCGKSNLQCVAGSIVPCNPQFTLGTLLGQTYHMVVYSPLRNQFNDPRGFELLLSSYPEPVVTADTCALAVPIVIGTALTGNLTAATPDGANVPSDCVSNAPIVGRGMWFTFNGTGGNVTADTCRTKVSVPTHISVYTGTCGPASLQCVKGTYNPCTIPKFTFVTKAGTQYYINVRSVTDIVQIPGLFDLTLYIEGQAVTLTPTKAPVLAPVGPVPTPAAPIPTAPVPRAPTPSAPVPTAPVPIAPKAPMVVPVSAPAVAPVSAPSVPAPSPIAPVTAPEPCGLLGLRLLCLTGCGLLGRLLKLCQD